jgi:hypothetical protein
MRRIHWLILSAMAALLLNVGSVAAAPPDYGVAERMCTAYKMASSSTTRSIPTAALAL